MIKLAKPILLLICLFLQPFVNIETKISIIWCYIAAVRLIEYLEKYSK